MRTRVLTALLVVALGGSLHAMGIRTETRVLGWSKDGQTVVLDEGASGPEGGGSNSLVVVTTGVPHVTRFMLSSDFSPGNGSRPERVSVAACTSAARQLATRLKGVPGLRVQPARCKGDRGLIVVMDAARQKALGATALPGAGLSLRAGAVQQLELVKDGKRVVAFPSAGWSVDEIEATLGPAGHLLILLSGGRFGALGSPSGKLGDLVFIGP